jgi:hypothetical protein
MTRLVDPWEFYAAMLKVNASVGARLRFGTGLRRRPEPRLRSLLLDVSPIPLRAGDNERTIDAVLLPRPRPLGAQVFLGQGVRLDEGKSPEPLQRCRGARGHHRLERSPGTAEDRTRQQGDWGAPAINHTSGVPLSVPTVNGEMA